MDREALRWPAGFSPVARAGAIAGLFAFALLFPASSLRADPFLDALNGTNADAAAGASSLASGTAAVALDKAAGTPHFWQRDSRGAFENEGRDYCCPVAVSNSLAYLAHHGFPALLPDGDGVQPQIDLINLLASSDYFETDPANGTSPGTVLSGVEKYVQAQGYQCERLEYEGWRKVGRSQQDKIKASRPDLDWLKEGILNPHGAVWLNIGWYVRSGDSDQEWKRNGGHWVTLVGYGAADPGDTPNPQLLLIHNPATRGNGDAPDLAAQDVVYLQQVDAGTLDTGKDSTEDAAGMYQISGPGLPKGKNVVAFLDAAIVLVVKP
jgi:hypothetical protein